MAPKPPLAAHTWPGTATHAIPITASVTAAASCFLLLVFKYTKINSLKFVEQYISSADAAGTKAFA